MKLFSWLHKPKHAIEAAREEKRLNRGQLASKVVQLDEQRHVLDEMVRRSLELMEHKQ